MLVILPRHRSADKLTDAIHGNKATSFLLSTQESLERLCPEIQFGHQSATTIRDLQTAIISVTIEDFLQAKQVIEGPEVSIAACAHHSSRWMSCLLAIGREYEVLRSEGVPKYTAKAGQFR